MQAKRHLALAYSRTCGGTSLFLGNGDPSQADRCFFANSALVTSAWRLIYSDHDNRNEQGLLSKLFDNTSRLADSERYRHDFTMEYARWDGDTFREWWSYSRPWPSAIRQPRRSWTFDAEHYRNAILLRNLVNWYV